MAKEYETFKTTFKPLKEKAGKYNNEAVAKLDKRMDTAWKMICDAPLTVRGVAAKAVRAGVDPSDLGAMMKDPGVKEIVANWTLLANHLDEDIKVVDAFIFDAKTVLSDLTKLHGKIEKDLSTRKDSSESKKDIIKLKGEVKVCIDSVNAAIKGADDLIGPKMRNYGKNLSKEIALILKESSKDLNELSQKQDELDYSLKDRVLAKAVSDANVLRLKVVETCQEAITLQDKEAAATKIKGLAPTMKKLTEMGRYHAKLKSDNFDMIMRNPAGPKIIKLLDSIAGSVAAANKTFNSTVLALKKAG